MDRSPRGVLRATGIGSPGLIDVLGRAIAAISHHECRDGIDCYLKLSFGLPLQLYAHGTSPMLTHTRVPTGRGLVCVVL